MKRIRASVTPPWEDPEPSDEIDRKRSQLPDRASTAKVNDTSVAKQGRKVDLFLDSGAYSAWNQNEVIDLKKYIAYLKQNYKYLWAYVNLDVLPPGEERRRTHEMVDKAAKQSYKNLQVMKDAGLAPIPVYHQGESLHYLDQMLIDGEEYIGISCRKDLMAAEQRKWLDMVFSYITDRDGKPLVKTHGFGITRTGFILRYPFYSVDSTTWSLTPAYGQIIIPASDVEGEFDFTRTPGRVVLSGVTHKTKSSQKKQFEALGGVQSEIDDDSLQQKLVKKFLDDYVGCDVCEARYLPNMRRKCVLAYYDELCKAVSDIRYKGPRATVFGPDHYDTRKMKPVEPFHPHVFFATSLSKEWALLMNDVRARTRLLSFYEMQHLGNDVLQRYVLDGTLGEYVPSKQRADWSENYLNRRRLALHYRLQELRSIKSDEEYYKMQERKNGKTGAGEGSERKVRIRAGG